MKMWTVKKLDKKELRKTVYEKAAGLDEGYKLAAREEISRKVLESKAFRDAKTLFVFLNTENEPDTELILEAAKAAGKRVCVPRCKQKPFMDAVELAEETRFSAGSFGIREPENGRVVAPSDIDLAIVPCVSVTADGRRLGHGGGFYDAFLRSLDAVKMCVCFKKLLLHDIPVTENDVNMDIVITE